MYVLLINPRFPTMERPKHVPYGLLQLASLVNQRGHKVAVLDDNVLRVPIEAFQQDVKKEADFNKQPWDVIGIAGYSMQYRFIKQMVPILRKDYPDSVIVGGGEFVTSQPTEMLKWLPEMDIGCIGESYKTFAEILDHVEDEDWKKIKGLVYRNGKSTRLTKPRKPIQDYYYCKDHHENRYSFVEAAVKDFECGCGNQLVNNLDEEVPYYPAYEYSQLEHYFAFSALPYSPECSSAQTLRLDARASYNNRWHSPEYVVDLITHLRLKYAINFVSFIDQNFVSNQSWFFRFCELFEDSELSTVIKWGMAADVNSVDAELLQKAKDVGCRYIQYGSDTFSRKLLENMGVTRTKKDVERAIHATQNEAMNPILDFTIGYPGTTIDDIVGDVKAFVENQIASVPHFLHPYPGTAYYDRDKIIEQYITDEEKAFLENPTVETYLAIGESSPSLYLVDHLTYDGVPSKSQLIKTLPSIQEKLHSAILERWLLSLSDELSVNLTDFTDVELIGLRHLMSTDGVRLLNKNADLRRLKKYKSSLTIKKCDLHG